MEKRPKYKLFEEVIYRAEDQSGNCNVGRIENISLTQNGWRYYFHNGSSCWEENVIEKLTQ